VCVSERERDSQEKREIGKETERKCVCVCERERERERERRNERECRKEWCLCSQL